MVETVTYTEKEIKSILSNYHWMIREVKRINDQLKVPDVNVTSQYGIESTLPKPKHKSSNILDNEVIRRDKKYKRKIKMIEKVEFVQERIHLIKNDREKVVLDCLLDGMSIIAISKHMGLSRKHIERLRDSIAKDMSQMS